MMNYFVWLIIAIASLPTNFLFLPELPLFFIFIVCVLFLYNILSVPFNSFYKNVVHNYKKNLIENSEEKLLNIKKRKENIFSFLVLTTNIVSVFPNKH